GGVNSGQAGVRSNIAAEILVRFRELLFRILRPRFIETRSEPSLPDAIPDRLVVVRLDDGVESLIGKLRVIGAEPQHQQIVATRERRQTRTDDTLKSFLSPLKPSEWRQQRSALGDLPEERTSVDLLAETPALLLRGCDVAVRIVAIVEVGGTAGPDS